MDIRVLHVAVRDGGIFCSATENSPIFLRATRIRIEVTMADGKVADNGFINTMKEAVPFARSVYGFVRLIYAIDGMTIAVEETMELFIHIISLVKAHGRPFCIIVRVGLVEIAVFAHDALVEHDVAGHAEIHAFICLSVVYHVGEVGQVLGFGDEVGVVLRAATATEGGRRLRRGIGPASVLGLLRLRSGSGGVHQEHEAKQR